MRRYRRIIPAVLLMTTMGCSMAAVGEMRTIKVEGLSLKVAGTEIVGHYEGPPAFLRVHYDAGFDLVLDDRFRQIRDPDYLSVIPTQYGQGTVHQVGRHTIRCVDVPNFACGLKAAHGGVEYVIVFDQPPADEATIDRAERSAVNFLTERQDHA